MENRFEELVLKYYKKPNSKNKAPITSTSSPQNLFSKKRFSPCLIDEKTLYGIDIINAKVHKKPSKNPNPKKCKQPTARKPLINKKNGVNGKAPLAKNENKKELNQPTILNSPLPNAKRVQDQKLAGTKAKKELCTSVKTCLSPRCTQKSSVKPPARESAKRKSSIADYQIVRQVGQGAYAVVKEAIDKRTSSRVAIKVYDKKLLDSQQRKSIDSEIRLLQQLSHDNIVKFVEVIDEAKELFLIMEFVEGESLYSYIKSKIEKRLGEDEARGLFRQILSAVQYCHRRHISHRDLKLENVLLTTRYSIKVIDFGFSVCVPHPAKLKNFCGTPSYMSPEIVNKEEYSAPGADMWALGVLFYTLVSGRLPFRGASDKELFRQIAKGQFSFSSRTSDKCQVFIKRFLQVEPEKRITCEEALRDPFMTASDKVPLMLSSSYNQDVIKRIVTLLISCR